MELTAEQKELKKELYTLENSFYKNYARDLLVKFKNKITRANNAHLAH